MLNWKFSGKSPALVLSSGHCWFQNRKPDGIYLNDVINAIEKHPDHPQHVFRIDRMVKLGEALENGHINEIGLVMPHHSTIRIAGMKQKRIFEYEPKNGKELISDTYESKPKEVRE